jgi:hypothetical protein
MFDTKTLWNTITQSASILSIGLAVGWLTGLSLSPVVGQVLGAVLGIAGGIVVSLRTLKSERPEADKAHILSIDALPAALLIVGIALGAPLGIMARTHEVFLPSRFRTVAPPVSPGKESSHVEVPQPAGVNENGPGLYDKHTTECGEFLGVKDRDEILQKTMLDSESKWAVTLAKNEKNPAVLRSVVEALCAQ